MAKSARRLGRGLDSLVSTLPAPDGGTASTAVPLTPAGPSPPAVATPIEGVEARMLPVDRLTRNPYQPRNPELDDDVPAGEKSRRLAAVHEMVEGIERDWRASFVGQTLEVLVEGQGRMPGQLNGRARNNQIANFVAQNGGTIESLRGALVPVEITAANPHSLEGTA